jgi:hypothetical protein
LLLQPVAPQAPPVMQSLTELQPQTPAMHAFPPTPPLQTVPHFPQLFGSVESSTQCPEQFVSPLAHCNEPEHVPFEQAWPDGHAWPHAPQLEPFDLRSTQAPEHRVWPGGQPWNVVAHAPLWQNWPDGHAWPHAPQLCVSVLRSTQPVGHDVRPAGHSQRGLWGFLCVTQCSPRLQHLLPQCTCPGLQWGVAATASAAQPQIGELSDAPTASVSARLREISSLAITRASESS